MKMVDHEIEKFYTKHLDGNQNWKSDLIMFSGVDDELQQIYDKLSEVT